MTDPLAVPPALAAALAGLPEPGTWETACLLLTATTEGIVDICMLSRAEIDAAPDALFVVIASRKARANLSRTQHATLLAFAGGCAYYLALEQADVLEGEGTNGYRFVVRRVFGDDVGVRLRPLGYRVEPHLRESEDWDRSGRLLAELQSRHH